MAPIRSAVVVASRRAGEPWQCLEQPDRDAIALAGLGAVRMLEASGAPLRRSGGALAGAALADDAAGAPGAGLVALGGFAFAPGGGDSSMWSGSRPASLVVPEVWLARRGRRTWLTGTSTSRPTTWRATWWRGCSGAWASYEAPLPLFDPAPTGAYDVVSPMPPAHFEGGGRPRYRAHPRRRAGEDGAGP